MDILTEIDNKEKELTNCYAIIQLQQEKLKDIIEKVGHLEKLLMHRAEILDFNKDK